MLNNKNEQIVFAQTYSKNKICANMTKIDTIAAEY